MKHCDKSITIKIKALTPLIKSYRFTQIKHIPLTSLLRQWILLTVICDRKYNKNINSYTMMLVLCAYAKIDILTIYMPQFGRESVVAYTKMKFLNIFNLTYITYLSYSTRSHLNLHVIIIYYHQNSWMSS